MAEANSRSAKSGGSTSVRTTLGLLPMIALSTTLAEPAFAQSTGEAAGTTQLERINVFGGQGSNTGASYKADRVTSKKATAPLVDTPQTVTVINQDFIEERAATDLTEVLKNTPGISFNAGENGFATSTNNFQLRGFDSSGSVYEDGFRDSGSFKRDTFNTEAVEVVKGAAADNGRGGPGGYVNMATKTPLLEDFIKAAAGISVSDKGGDPLYRASADVNQRFGETMAVRLNAMWENGGVMGREIAENSAWGFAPSIAFGLGTDFRAILSYEHYERDDRPDWGVPGATVPGLKTYNPVTAGVGRDTFYGLNSDFDDTKRDAFLALFEYDINDHVTITNQTKLSRTDRTARYTIPTGFTAPSTVTSQTQFYDRRNSFAGNQTNLAAEFETGALKHHLSAGLEFSWEGSDANRYGTVNPGDTDLFVPDPSRDPGAPFNSTQANSIGVKTAAAYVYDTIEFNDRWLLSGGLRAEHYNVRLDDSTGSSTFTDSQFTLGGKIGLVYKPTRDGSVYASYGVSHLPPGSYLSNPDISRTGDNAFPGYVPGAKPIYSRNYEVGVKWEFLGGRLAASAAAFRTEKHNVAWTGRDVGETVTTLKGYGQQIVQGIELGIAGDITDRWSVFGGLNINDSWRKHSAYLDDVRRRANPADYGTYTSTNGDKLAFTPAVTASLWTTYQVTEKLTLGGGFQYVGSSYLGRPDDALRVIPNGQFGKLPSYFLVNLMASYDINDKVKLRFNVDNVFDEKYAVATNWNGSRATLGTPRTFRFGTSFNF